MTNLKIKRIKLFIKDYVKECLYYLGVIDLPWWERPEY